MRRLTPLVLFFATVAAVTGGVLVSGQSKVAVQAAVLVQTDSLRAETYRTGNRAPRKTVIRRLATRIDSILLAWKPDTVFRVDTVFVRDSVPVPPVDTTTRPDTTTQPDTTPEVPPVDTTTAPPAPTDTTVLGRIGPTRSSAQAATLGGGYAMMDPLFAQWEPTRFATDGTQWSGSNYYDRALIYYAMAARTGNATWRQRADAIALDYRRKYLHANNYQTSPHWAQLDGVALHFWLTGDDSSRIAVGKAAWNLAGTAVWPTTNPYNDARTQARALTGMLLAWQMNAPNAPSGGWALALDRGIDSVLAQQNPDGGWRYANTCNLSLNYMSAMLTDALIRVHDTYRADPRIPVAVKRGADFLWTQWRPNDAVPSFNYYEALCSNQHGTGGPTATPDLIGLFTSTYAWLAARDPAYRAKADAVFSATMRGIYPQGSKQFNQAFAYSWRALGYLP